jgi:pyridinium-3,5-biscarboxylic acid mononucleotide synthase
MYIALSCMPPYIDGMDSALTTTEILRRLLQGEMAPEDCVRAIEAGRSHTLTVDGIARLDPGRRERTGFPEVILAEGKSDDDLLRILETLRDADRNSILVSRLAKRLFASCAEILPDAEYHQRSGMAVFRPDPPEELKGDIALITAGTADLGIAEEIEIACRYAGSSVRCFADVGVAGLHRLLDIVPELERARVIVCVAGMEAALPSVLAGLLSVPVIGVPVSTGYGVNTGGWNALLSMLGSCAPGVLTVNIDNGIGAAAAAHRINLLGEGKDR